MKFKNSLLKIFFVIPKWKKDLRTLPDYQYFVLLLFVHRSKMKYIINIWPVHHWSQLLEKLINWSILLEKLILVWSLFFKFQIHLSFMDFALCNETLSINKVNYESSQFYDALIATFYSLSLLSSNSYLNSCYPCYKCAKIK